MNLFFNYIVSACHCCCMGLKSSCKSHFLDAGIPLKLTSSLAHTITSSQPSFLPQSLGLVRFNGRICGRILHRHVSFGEIRGFFFVLHFAPSGDMAISIFQIVEMALSLFFCPQMLKTEPCAFWIEN